MRSAPAMTLEDALQVLHEIRDQQIVVSSMSAARDWMQRSTHPLDFHYVPSTMGGGFPLGLGIALAQPQRDVIVLNGDGCVLMNLGSLITSAVSGATNFTGIIIDNGNYETTGGQQLATTGSSIELADFGRAAHFPTVREFAAADAWRTEIRAVLAAPGPRCIILKVSSQGDNTLRSPGPMPVRVSEFRAAIASK
jgi:sulfopyruvate decarboxylase subunit beta